MRIKCNNDYDCSEYVYNQYVDMEGNPVERSKDKYPYSYDPYVTYKSIDYDKEKSNWVYSDRMYQWDYNKYNECCRKVWNNEGQYFDNRDSEQIEEFLNLYFDKKVKLTGIMEGCNYSSGYPYWIFCYEYVEEKK